MLLVISAIFSPFAMYSFVLTVPALPLKKKNPHRRHSGLVRILQPNWLVGILTYFRCYLIAAWITWGEKNHRCPERKEAERHCVLR